MVTATGAVMLMIVGMALPVQMGMVMGMIVIVGVGMIMGMAVDLIPMGMLVGMGMGMLMVVSTDMVMMKMHSDLSFYIIIVAYIIIYPPPYVKAFMPSPALLPQGGSKPRKPVDNCKPSCYTRFTRVDQKGGIPMSRDLTVTPAEWPIMELLWQSPKTLMELVSTLSREQGWSKSTITTMVRRMDEKGLITYHTEGRAKIFRPAVARDEITARETGDLLRRAYHGSVGMMISAMAHRNDLSKEDIAQLYAILKEAEVDAE